MSLRSLINRLRHCELYSEKFGTLTQEHAVILFLTSSVIPRSHPQYAQLLLVCPKYYLEKRQHMLWLFLGYIRACWYLQLSTDGQNEMN